MSYKHKSIWYSKIVASSEPPGIIRFLMNVGCTGREAVFLVVLFATIGFVAAGAIVLDTTGLTKAKTVGGGYYGPVSIPNSYNL